MFFQVLLTRSIGNMGLPVKSKICAISINNSHRIVMHIICFFKETNWYNHSQLLRKLLHPTNMHIERTSQVVIGTLTHANRTSNKTPEVIRIFTSQWLDAPDMVLLDGRSPPFELDKSNSPRTTPEM